MKGISDLANPWLLSVRAEEETLTARVSSTSLKGRSVFPEITTSCPVREQQAGQAER